MTSCQDIKGGFGHELKVGKRDVKVYSWRRGWLRRCKKKNQWSIQWFSKFGFFLFIYFNAFNMSVFFFQIMLYKIVQNSAQDNRSRRTDSRIDHVEEDAQTAELTM